MLSFKHFTSLAFVALGAAIVPSTVCAQVDDRALSTSAIAEGAIPATVTILALNARGDTLGQGSGFFVRTDGVLVTNWHVMVGAARAIVIRNNGERFERVSFLDGDYDSDIAILKVPGYALPILEPRADAPAVGERVVAIGSPLGLSHTVTEGIVSARRMIDGRELVQMTAAISSGSSGGAVLDGHGRVFAVSTLYINGGQQLNFAIPIRYALGLIPQALTEHSLAEAFSAPDEAGSRQTIGSSSTAERTNTEQPALPPPTAQPRLPLEGTWVVARDWYGPDVPDDISEVGLLIAKDRVGLLLLTWKLADGTFDSTRVTFVETLRATQDGQVAMAAGDFDYGGHQTADGLALESRITLDERYKIVLRAIAYEFPISKNTGLYTAVLKTDYQDSNGRLTNTRLSWVGDMAIGFSNGDICLDLYVANAAGGTQALYGCAPMTENGNFRVSRQRDARASVSLEGYVRAGVLRGKWIDQRENGARFEGFLEGQRR